MELDCVGNLMDAQMRVKEKQLQTKFKLITSLEGDKKTPLMSGGVLSRGLSLEVTRKDSEQSLWPVYYSTVKTKIQVEVPEGGKNLIIKLGQWSSKVSVLFEGVLREGTGDYVDSTFSCPWPELKTQEEKKVYDIETVTVGAGRWTSTAGLKPFKAKVFLADCNPIEGSSKKQANCTLKVVIRSYKRIQLNQKQYC